MDFLWHKVSEKEKEEIKEQAKKIIDNFSKKLEKVKREIKETDDNILNSGRDEKNGESLAMDKKIMFDNAPSKNDGFIIAEKGEW